MNKRTTLPTLIASTTLIGAASYFLFTPVKTKVLKELDKVKTNKSAAINESYEMSHEEAYFI